MRGVVALGPVPGDVGHAGLSSAFVVFCDRWEWGVRTAVRRGGIWPTSCGRPGTLTGRPTALVRTCWRGSSSTSWAIRAGRGHVGDVGAAALPDRRDAGLGRLGAEWADTAGISPTTRGPG